MKQAEIEMQIDNILACLGACTEDLARLGSQMETEMASVRKVYDQSMAADKDKIARLEADLENLVVKYRTAVLKGKDRLDLRYGAVMLKTEIRVKRIRDMLARLEEAQRMELIKIAKMVDWDMVEKLSDADLKALGTKRIPRDRFSYELR
jgi:Na+/phosphate symporter